MPLPVFPGPGVIAACPASKWTFNFFNQTTTTVTGADIDIGLALYPLHDFELDYEFLRDGPRWGGVLAGLELRTMMGFFMMMRGSLGRFLYHNFEDWQVFQQPIGIGDGTTTTFPLVRTYGANGFFSTEPVGQVDLGQLFNAYLNGAAVPVAPDTYTISTENPCANTITFAAPPPAGQNVAVDMAYLYYCKMAANSGTFEKFMDRIHSIGKVKLHSCRAGDAPRGGAGYSAITLAGVASGSLDFSLAEQAGGINAL